MNSNTAGQDGLIPKPREFNHRGDIAANTRTVYSVEQLIEMQRLRLYRDCWAEEPCPKLLAGSRLSDTGVFTLITLSSCS